MNIKQTYTDMILDTIETAINLNLIKNPVAFKKRFYIEFSERDICRGGIDITGDPMVEVSTAIRYTNPSEYKEQLKLFSYKKKNWSRAASFVRQYNICAHVEYASIDRDPTIGAIVTDDPKMSMLFVATHEVAHAIQYWNWAFTPFAARPKPHGSEWRSIYAALRRTLVNPHVKTYADFNTEPVKQTPVKNKQQTINGIKRTRKNTAIYHLIFAVLKGGTIDDIEAHLVAHGVNWKRDSIKAAIAWDIKQKGYIVSVSDGYYTITNSVTVV